MTWRDFRSLPGNCPVTWGVIVANGVTFLLSFLGWHLPLAYHPHSVAERPWTVFTYALDGAGPVVSLLLSAYVFGLFGGSLERAWLVRDYVRFLLLTTPAPALALWLAGAWTGRTAGLAGLWLPVAACAVAWSRLHPTERLLAYFVVPLEGRWVGVLSTVLVFFSFPFPLGVPALAGCAVAWWYVRGGRYGVVRWPGRAANPLEAYRRWRRKREFLRLMRRSGLH